MSRRSKDGKGGDVTRWPGAGLSKAYLRSNPVTKASREPSRPRPAITQCVRLEVPHIHQTTREAPQD